MKITFTNTLNYNLETPKPASNYIPQWYKDISSYKDNDKHPGKLGGTATIKKCMPIFDAITTGYIITSPADLYIRDGVNFSWPNAGLVSFHASWQTTNHPLSNQYEIPKFTSPWSIRTPKGYSTLFVQPFHRESVFTIFPGIVDTDTYRGTVNFPFVLNNPNFTGVISKGTPIAQVIPFKRESWKSEMGDNKEKKLVEQTQEELRSTFYDYYKRMWHRKKEYK